MSDYQVLGCPPSHWPEVARSNRFLQIPTRWDITKDRLGRTQIIIDLRSPSPDRERHARALVKRLDSGENAWLIANPMMTKPEGKGEGLLLWAVLEIRCPDLSTTAVEMPIKLDAIGVATLATIKKCPDVLFYLPGDMVLELPLARWSVGLDHTASNMLLKYDDIMMEAMSGNVQGVSP
jgi:hypothetical protein